MKVFGFSVLCILACIAAIILATMFVIGFIYLLNYIMCDFRERKHRWAVEARQKQVYTFMRNTVNRYMHDGEDKTSEADTVETAEERDSDSEGAEEQQTSDDKEDKDIQFEDIINKVCE